MKKNIFLFCLVFFSFFYTNAQAPNSTSVNDQIVQGPCYIFATVAALESKAIVGGSSSGIDLFEWNLYSKYVLGGRSSSGYNMVKKVLAHAGTAGIYPADLVTGAPTVVGDLPNPNDPNVRGIADFQGCSPFFAKNYYQKTNKGESFCQDDEGTYFAIEPFISENDCPFRYDYQGDGYVYVDGPVTETQLEDELNQGRGLIAFFSTWNGGGPHAVFIHGRQGTDWKFKDSWPGDAGNKTDPLIIANCTGYYYLTGTVSNETPGDCESEIIGSSTVSGNTTYRLNGSVRDIHWEITGNLIKVSEDEANSTVTVKPRFCNNSTGTIIATYSSGCSVDCEASKVVDVIQLTETPTDILVFSPDWNNGQTCPNTELELSVVDNNPAYPSTTYDWNITGATVTGGGDPFPFAFVRTFSATNANLVFSVRAKVGSCGFSGWKTINGTTSGKNCSKGGGDGGPLFQGNTQEVAFNDLFDHYENINELNYQVVSIDGKVSQKGTINKFDSTIDISQQKESLIIIHLYDATGSFQKTFKYVRPNNSSF